MLAVGLGLATGLVLFGAELAGTPVAPPAMGQPGTAAQPRAITVILRDYKFDPTPLYLYPGETIRLSIVNGGLVEHELTLGDAAVQQAWAAADALASPAAPFATAPPASVRPGVGGLRVVVASGQSVSIEYAVPDGAAPQLVCNLPGHAERGMIGQVVLLSR